MFINVSYKSAMFFNLGLGLNVSVKVGAAYTQVHLQYL